MNDLISKEIAENQKYISENGLIKFYKKSKYLSKVWKIYKTKFDDVCSIIESTELYTFPKDNLALRSFIFITNSLKINFEEYYIDREIIVKRENIEYENGKFVDINKVSFGKKTNQYNVIENRVSYLIDDFFSLIYFLNPLSEYFQNIYSKTDKRLQIVESDKDGITKELSNAHRLLKRKDKVKGKFVELRYLKSDDSF